MTVRLWALALFAAVLTTACERESPCAALCEKLADCRFLPGPLGLDPENCESRCRASQKLGGELNHCTDGQPAVWIDSDLELLGCPSIARCLDQTIGGRGLQGYGRVQVIPTLMTLDSGSGGGSVKSGGPPSQLSEVECSGGTAPLNRDEAQELCKSWNVPRATLLLRDDAGAIVARSGDERRVLPTSPRTYTGDCVTVLSGQPVFEHIQTGRLTAALVLEATTTQEGGTGGMNAIGGPPTIQDAGAAGEVLGLPDEPERCVVFGAPVQVNRSGDQCVGILVPVERDISAARPCERGDLCSDGRDNDGDTWVDCDDPKCQTTCAELRTTTVEATGGANGAE